MEPNTQPQPSPSITEPPVTPANTQGESQSSFKETPLNFSRRQGVVLETKKNFPLLPLILILLFLSATTATAFLYFQNQSLKSQLSSLTQVIANPEGTLSEPTPEAMMEEDPTADWKTYINPTQTYSFKHPNGLLSDTKASGSGYESIKFTLVGPTQIASGRTQTELFDGYSFSVTKIGPSEQYKAQIEIDKQIEDSKGACQEVDPAETVIVNNIQAYRYFGNCLGTFYTIFISDGRDTYRISQLFTNDNYKLITDQILSTFEFTESESTPVSTQSASPS